MLVGNWLKQRRQLHIHISVCFQYLRTCEGSSLNRGIVDNVNYKSKDDIHMSLKGL